MTDTCPFENRNHREFFIESLQNQTNTGETQFETLYCFNK